MTPSRSGPRNRPLSLVAAGLVAAAGGLITACGDRGSSSKTGARPAADAVEVALAPVVRESVEQTVRVTGTLFADEDMVISAKLAGRIVAIQRDVGDEVLPGQPLAQIDRRDYELALGERRAAAAATLAKVGLTDLPPADFDPVMLPTVAKARAEAANAEAKAQRAQRLFEQTPPLIAEQDYADIRTSWEALRQQAEVELLAARAIIADARVQAAAVATAEQRLADTTVVAPAIEGRPGLRYRVAERTTSVGEYVEQTRPLFRLVATDAIKFRAHVPERYAAMVAVGQAARADVEGRTQTRVGRVTRAAPVVDPASRTFMVEIVIENADGRLKPGAFAEGSIVVGRRENAALVPERAIVSFAGVSRVFSVADGKAVEHRVQPGTRRDGVVEVVPDIAADRVVVEGAAGLANGTAVRVRGGERASGAP